MAADDNDRPADGDIPETEQDRDAEQSRDASQQAYTSASQNIPPIDFTTFILSLSTSALVQLGEAHEEGGEPRINLPMARQTIDLLGLLEEKTKGNLTGEEERLLHQVLFDLRVRFVAKTKEQQGSS